MGSGRLCFMVVGPPLCSILFGVENRGYCFSTHGFLNFTFSVLKLETNQRYSAFLFKGDPWECLLSSEGVSPSLILPGWDGTASKPFVEELRSGRHQELVV